MIGALQWWRMWPTMLVGAISGLALIPVGDWAAHVARDAYDAAHPVVVAQGVVVGRDGESVTIAVVGEKLRNCQYIAVAAYTTGDDGLLRSAYVMRVDQPSTGATRPIGKQSFGEWRIWPTDKTKRVEIWLSHQCDGRIIRSKVADMPLAGPIS